VATERRLTDQGLQRRQQLLDRAVELFAARGYADTRVVDICEAAGVAKGLFYWYFENKDALFADVVRTMRRRLRRAQAAAIDRDADPLTRLAQGTAASVRFMAEHLAWFTVLDAEQHAPTVRALLWEGTAEHAADTAAIIADGQRAGAVDDDVDPLVLAYAVVGAVAHFTWFHRKGRLGLDVDELVRVASRWVVQAVAGDVPGGPSALSPLPAAASR
jgi:AcrR family transcriptional regulator